MVTSLSVRINLQNDDEQQRMLIDILQQKYPRQHVSSSSSAVSTPMMVRKANLINYQFDIYVLSSHDRLIHRINVHHRLTHMMKNYHREIQMVGEE